LFGVQQTLGLQVLQRRNLPVPQKHAPQVAVAHAQLGCQRRHAGGPGAPLNGRLQLSRGSFGQNCLGIGGGPEAAGRRQLRAATQARSETMGFGLGGCFKKRQCV